MTEFTLAPYVGASPITFDMLSIDVERILGRPGRVGMNSLGEKEEQRGPFIVRYSKTDGRAVELAFLPGATAFLRGEDLFTKANVVDFLATLDTPYEFVGFLVFLGLGLTLTGFHDSDDCQKAITVFRQRRWDEFRSQFIPFEGPK